MAHGGIYLCNLENSNKIFIIEWGIIESLRFNINTIQYTNNTICKTQCFPLTFCKCKYLYYAMLCYVLRVLKKITP